MFKNSIHDPKILDEVLHLVDSKKVETKLIEYKSQLPDGSAKSDISCLLKPVCSFANTNDGYIIYGVTAKDGIPEKLTGIEIPDIDDCKLRLENLIRDNIEDQLNVIDIAAHQIQGSSKYILIMHVRKSWYGPHRVTKNNTFYARNSAGSYQMDLAEIRSSVTMSSGLLDNVNKFIIKRSIAIQDGKSGVQLVHGATIALHVLPLSAFMLNSTRVMRELAKVSDAKRPNVYRINSWQKKIVLEGILAGDYRGASCHRYDLFFKNGIVESVTVIPPREFIDVHHECIFPSNYVESFLIDDVNRFLGILEDLKFAPPFVFYVTLSGVGNYRLGTDRNKLYQFDRDIIQLSSEVVNTNDVSAEAILKDIFDSIWHSCGRVGSENYNEAGERIVA